MKIYEETTLFLEQCFQQLEGVIPPPTIVERGGEKTLRYVEQTLEQAAVQKLARYISGLNASLLLLKGGYVQEASSIFRMLDEFQEDITFLLLPRFGKKRSKTHDEYLEYFYQEEFDYPKNAISSRQNRPTVSRKNIRSQIANSGLSGLNPHDSMNLSRTISQAYSGYLHGASEHILEMTDVSTGKYMLDGLPQSWQQDDLYYNYWDYLFRGIVATALVANALGDGEIAKACARFRDKFEALSGKRSQGKVNDLNELMKKSKEKEK